MAYDIPSISDLEAIQLLNKHYAEVITSKKDGVSSAADITQTTNPITGVTRRTLYKILDDMDDTFLERLLKMAFTPVGTFTAGATLTDARQTLLWEASEGGDGRYYSWSGSFPKIVAPSSSPSPITSGSWVDRTDDSLRDEIRETVFQNTKRLYAEAGCNLVAGSFEAGGTLVNANDVLLHEASGKAFSGPAGNVAAGTDPASGGFVDVSNVSLYEFNAETYGLKETNTGLENCKALQALSAAVMAAGGGTVIFPRGEFTVGAQEFAGSFGKRYAYKAIDMFFIKGCDTVNLQFNGTKFKAASGLKSGSFDPVTGQVYNPPDGVFINRDYRAEIGRVIRVEDCTSITISGCAEFDGSDGTRIIGGRWGDIGLQVWDTAIYLTRYEMLISTANIKSHKWVADCLYVAGKYGGDTFMTYIRNFTGIKAGRNCLSLTGGSNVTFGNCVFGFCGQGDSVSPMPRASMDVEAEIDKMSNLLFEDCKFLDSPEGVVSDSFNRVLGARFVRCEFRAKNANNQALFWKVWGTDFVDCTITGLITVVGGGVGGPNADQLPENIRFNGCTLTNILPDGSVTPGRANTRALVGNVIKTDNFKGKALTVEFNETKFKARLDEQGSGGRNCVGIFRYAKFKNCEMEIGGLLTETTAVLAFDDAYIDGLLITNKLDYQGDPNIRIGITTARAKIKGAYLTEFLSTTDGKPTILWANPYLSGGGNFGWYTTATSGDFGVEPIAALGLMKGAQFTQEVTRRYGGGQVITSEYQLPTAGDYSRGDIVLHWDALPGEPMGWQCTTTGVAGSTAVFKPLANVGV